MKKILVLCLFVISLYANESEKLFWDEVKNSSDIELLRLYKKQYPKGVFEKIADIKIKRLKKATTPVLSKNGKPFWIKGKVNYRFYGLGKANKHFKGKHYQENLSRSRARRNLQDLYEDKKLSYEQISEYQTYEEIKTYTDKRGRIYTLIYIENEDIY